MLTIIDYGMGNLTSVVNAFAAVDGAPVIASNPSQLADAERIVLPGVGSFGDGMNNLRAGDWIAELEKQVRQQGKPFLGICLGMQLLATTGTEHGEHAGLNWIPGTVERIQCGDEELRVPHVGWNDVDIQNQNGLYAGLGQEQTFYFVHSYVFHPESRDVVNGVCSYGSDWAASMQMDNVYATQYHPEKSHRAGLSVLSNFLKA
jgi:glutamine amidotransferase